MFSRSTAMAGTLPAYAGTEIAATSSFVIETSWKSNPLSVRSTVILVQRSSHKARHLLRSTRRTKHNFEYAHLDTLPLRLATRQAVFTSSQSIRHVGPRFNAPSTPMHPPYAVCLFVLYKLRYRLYIFTGYRRVLPRYPILARAKNGVFCNVTAPAPPRVGKTVGRRIILSPDMARITRPCSGKRRNLAQNAR